MDRRTYLKSLLVSGTGLLITPQFLISCKPNKESNFNSTFTQEPFKTFDEIRNAAIQSKGHLFHEMNRCIKSNNPEIIFDFVKNRFSIIPGSKNTIFNAAYDTRWGMQGVLRCGKGTIRELSDMLYYMLKEAGFNPSYYRQGFPLNKKLIRTIYCTPKKDNDLIEVSEKQLDKWNQNIQQLEIPELDLNIENAKEKSKNLSNLLLKQLPKNAHQELSDFDWLKIYNHELNEFENIEVPIIQIKHNQEIKDLNIIEDKLFQDFTNSKKDKFSLDYSNPNKKFNKVRVILRANYSESLNKPLELVRGEWDFYDLIGKQIALQFIPPMPLKNQLLSTYEDFQTFVPFLSLRDLQKTNDEKLKTSFKGIGFDLFGNTFEETRQGIKVNQIVLNETKNIDTKQISKLEATLSIDAYPKVKLRLKPLDKNNKIIYGLPASAFKIIDNQEQMQPFLLSNFKNPRLLILWDQSGSMPMEHFEFSKEEKNKIQKSFNNQYLDPIIDYKTHSSDLINQIIQHDFNNYDHIIFVGDAGEFENLTKQELNPILKDHSVSFHYIQSDLHQNYNLNNNPARKIMDKALFFDWNNIENNFEIIAKQVDQNNLFPYIFEYEPNQKAKTKSTKHQVQVSVQNNDQIKPININYQIDEGHVYKTYNFPVGLTLEIQWKENYETKSVFRNLVGFDERIHTNSSHLELSIFKNLVRDFALGTHFICFEPEKPTFPVLIDDLVQAQLSHAPLATEEPKNVDQLLKILNETYPLPAEALATFVGIPEAISKNSVTFEDNFQTAIYSEYYDSNNRVATFKIDMLATSNIKTFAPTKKEAFQKTLEQTAYLALSEANLFSQSTYNDLNNKTLQLYEGGNYLDQQHPLYPILQYTKSNYFHLLYDKDLKTASYWQINKNTGALLGILPDESGGGSIIKKQRLELALKIWETWTNLLVKVTKGGITMGIVALYGMFLAELYGLVALRINDLGAETDFEKDLEKLLKKYAKKAFKKVKKGLKKK